MKDIVKAIIDKIPTDSKSRVKLIATAILVIIFVFSWANAIKVMQKRRSRGKGQEVLSQDQDQVIAELPIIGDNPFVQGIDDEEDGLEWIRCPFCGKIYVNGASGVDVLLGILWDSKDPKAVINGEIVGIGDKINKYSVVDIDKNSVTLNDGTQDIKISLEE